MKFVIGGSLGLIGVFCLLVLFSPAGNHNSPGMVSEGSNFLGKWEWLDVVCRFHDDLSKYDVSMINIRFFPGIFTR